MEKDEKKNKKTPPQMIFFLLLCWQRWEFLFYVIPIHETGHVFITVLWPCAQEWVACLFVQNHTVCVCKHRRSYYVQICICGNDASCFPFVCKYAWLVLLFFFFFQIQRYEGASTIYGPYTLMAYIQVFKALAEAIAKVCASTCCH